MTPHSTYRLQLRREFDLAAAAALAPYLADLGVSHCYTSPLLMATPGSSHCYDVVDHARVNPELGGEDGRRRLVDALRRAGLGLVVDIVPNHMGVAVPAANPAWWDVLKYGPASAYADWFDIDFSRGKLVLPVLGAEPDALDQLSIVDGELRYHEHRFPIAPGTTSGSTTSGSTTSGSTTSGSTASGTAEIADDPREVHDRQHYALVSWRRGNSELNYRRFFAITGLAGIRVEDPRVFEATHREILRWYAAGELDGIRVDHPDGLRDPAAYLRRLADAAPAAWLVVEKILEVGEELADWPVAGTTGYDALREAGGVFIDRAAEPAFSALDTALSGSALSGSALSGSVLSGSVLSGSVLSGSVLSGSVLSGSATSWPELVHGAKAEAATGLFAAELGRLSRLAPDVPAVAAALAEIAACFAVYRSYLPVGADQLTHAVSAASRCRPDLSSTFDVLSVRLADPADELAIRFQQYTGAVMAKGVEDTAYYRYSRFTALNEVGGDPGEFGVPVVDLHVRAADRLTRWPAGMTTLSTHDTKRSEDVRARLAVLAELPDEWGTAVRRWMALAPIPDPGFAHLLWQAAVGAWPIEPERLHAYAGKAAREAALRTSWTDPDAGFEAAVHAAVDAMYADPLYTDISAFVTTIVGPGWSNSLGQKLIQLTMPGVPDTYQGSELWDDSLVDPDNRRPVDFAVRADLLARLDAGWQPAVDATGAAKLLVTSRALRLRRDRPELFGGYRPVFARGPAAEHVVAFDRGGAIAVATRLPVALRRRGGWGDALLPVEPGSRVDVLTGRHFDGGEVAIAELFAMYPVALLTPRGEV